MLKRVALHVLTTRWHLRRAFPAAALDHVEAAIKSSELRHAGELRVVLEATLSIDELYTRATPRERAVAVFKDLHVWDTAANNGVLIYVLFAERAIEIVADRGYNERVQPEAWRAACAIAEKAFRAGDFESGLIGLVDATGELIARYFPLQVGDINELSDRPVLL